MPVPVLAKRDLNQMVQMANYGSWSVLNGSESRPWTDETVEAKYRRASFVAVAISMATKYQASSIGLMDADIQAFSTGLVSRSTKNRTRQSAKRHLHGQKTILSCRFSMYRNETDTIVAIVGSRIRCIEIEFVSIVSDKFSLFVHAIYTAAHPHCQQRVSATK